jgi:hypothetical protein
MTEKHIVKTLALCICGFVLVAATGCGGPRFRIGCLPTATFGTRSPNPDGLGRHSYGPLKAAFERNGVLYTCRGGHIDTTHLRWNSDYTRYLSERTCKTLMKSKEGFSFHIVMERSRHDVTFTYPDGWDDTPTEAREQIARDVSYEVGAYLAYQATIWHEILTWFGTRFVGIEPEFNSAFSWEDSYSDLLGTHLAIEAMKDHEHSFNAAMTLALNRKLQELGVVDRKQALAITETVSGKWFKGNFSVDTTRRNFDIGLDGSVRPSVIDGSACNNEVEECPAWTLDILKQHGFSMDYQIKANVFEGGRIYSIVDADRIRPAEHYAQIIEYIKAQAVEKGYQFDE